MHGSDNPNGISKLRFWGKNAESMESVSYQHSCNNAKRSWEKRLFTLDLEPALGGVTISSMDSTNPVTVTAADGTTITVSDITYTTQKVSFLTAAGTNRTDYIVRVRVNTSGSPAQRLEGLLPLLVRDE